MPHRTSTWTSWSSSIAGNADLVVQTPEGLSFTIANLDLDQLQAVCPLFALSFDQLKNGRHRLKLSNCSVELAHRFLRFLDTREYSKTDPDTAEDIPCSMLMHAQLYHFGVLYDCAQLVEETRRNIYEICESACCVPRPPEGLVETIRFLYTCLRSNFGVRDVILHYCVQCFRYHRIAELPGFLALLMEVKAFEHDLFKINMERGFDDDGDDASSQIIQLPANPAVQTDFNPVDYLYHMFGSNNSTPITTPLVSPAISTTSAHSMRSPFTVVHRPRRQDGTSSAYDSDGYSSDNSAISDFQLVDCPTPGLLHQPSLPYRPLLQSAESSRRSDDPQPASTNSNSNQNLQETRHWEDDEDWSLWDDSLDEEGGAGGYPRQKSRQRAFYRNTEASGSTETIVATSHGSVDDDASGGVRYPESDEGESWEKLDTESEGLAAPERGSGV